MPNTFSTGYIDGSVTGTFIPFPFSTEVDVLLSPHPANSGTAWIISNPGSIGYPLKKGGDPLFLDDAADLSSLRGWFDVTGDKICYLIISKQ